MKKYLKEIVFAIHAVLFAVCLIPFYLHNKTLGQLSLALLILNYIGVLCSLAYFYDDKDFKFYSAFVIITGFYVFIPLTIRDYNEKKDIDECPVYTNVILDTVISYSGKNPSDNLEATYVVDDKRYKFNGQQRYNCGLKKGDTIAIVYACRYPEINRMLYQSVRDSSFYYEESR